MNLENFEIQYKNAVQKSLDQLQTVALLIAQIQIVTDNISQELQNLSQMVEEFINENKTN